MVRYQTAPQPVAYIRWIPEQLRQFSAHFSELRNLLLEGGAVQIHPYAIFADETGMLPLSATGVEGFEADLSVGIVRSALFSGKDA